MLRNFAKENGELTPRAALRIARRLGFRKQTTLEFIDSLTLCHGVEAFESVGGFWEYVNTGDTYAETVVLSPGWRFMVTTIGDILERPTHMKWSDKHNR